MRDTPTFEYHLWTHRLVSDFDLGELEPVSACQRMDGCLRVRRSDARRAPAPSSPPCFEDRFDNGDVWSIAWHIPGGYFVRFPGLCAFRILPGQMRIDCEPGPGVAQSAIAHMILDHAIPRLFSFKPGIAVLHASAIQVGDAVIAVLGQSGQGKSTLAAWFASQGYPLLTDDCLVVRRDEAAGQWIAQPSYHSVRLWPDSVGALGIANASLREFAGHSAKKRTGREVDFRFASGGAPLTACFVLGEPGAPAHSGPPELRPLAVNEAFPALAGAVFRIDPGDAGVNRREFEALTSLTGSVRFWSLGYERDYRWLPEVRDAMMDAVRADDGPEPTSQNRDMGHPGR